jgi:hypothetical protein
MRAGTSSSADTTGSGDVWLLGGMRRSLSQTIVKLIDHTLQIWRSMVIQDLLRVHRRFLLDVFLQLPFLFAR